MNIRYAGIEPGAMEGGAAWEPGEEREVSDALGLALVSGGLFEPADEEAEATIKAAAAAVVVSEDLPDGRGSIEDTTPAKVDPAGDAAAKTSKPVTSSKLVADAPAKGAADVPSGADATV